MSRNRFTNALTGVGLGYFLGPSLGLSRGGGAAIGGVLGAVAGGQRKSKLRRPRSKRSIKGRLRKSPLYRETYKEKKYSGVFGRKSPSMPASEHCGKTKMGLDGNIWISKRVNSKSKSFCKWQKVHV